jgi:hypothetical protein
VGRTDIGIALFLSLLCTTILVGLHPKIHHADSVVRETGRDLAAFLVPANFEDATSPSVGLEDPAFFHRPDV